MLLRNYRWNIGLREFGEFSKEATYLQNWAKVIRKSNIKNQRKRKKIAENQVNNRSGLSSEKQEIPQSPAKCSKLIN